MSGTIGLPRAAHGECSSSFLYGFLPVRMPAVTCLLCYLLRYIVGTSSLLPRYARRLQDFLGTNSPAPARAAELPPPVAPVTQPARSARYPSVHPGTAAETEMPHAHSYSAANKATCSTGESARDMPAPPPNAGYGYTTPAWSRPCPPLSTHCVICLVCSVLPAHAPPYRCNM